jgi:hypothetical protein
MKKFNCRKIGNKIKKKLQLTKLLWLFSKYNPKVFIQPNEKCRIVILGEAAL